MDEHQIKVSILVPFYKVENYVGRCVESLFTQTYKNIEYVFVNDCTPDGSMEVINEKIDKYGMTDNIKSVIETEILTAGGLLGITSVTNIWKKNIPPTEDENEKED